MLKTVLFDLDDTLHDDTFAFTTAAEEVAREIAAAHDVDALALKAAYVAETEGFWKRLTADQVRQKMTRLRFSMWQNALGSVGLRDAGLIQQTADRYSAYKKKYLVPFPGALDLLRDLKARGLRLGLLTNGVSETHHEKLALLEMTQYFDAIFLADEVGMVKPDPLLFAHACTRLGSAPAESAMVGDRYDRDIAGALVAGLYTIWVNVRNEAVPAGKPVPHATVGSILEVGAVLFERVP